MSERGVLGAVALLSLTAVGGVAWSGTHLGFARHGGLDLAMVAVLPLSVVVLSLASSSDLDGETRRRWRSFAAAGLVVAGLGVTAAVEVAQGRLDVGLSLTVAMAAALFVVGELRFGGAMVGRTWDLDARVRRRTSEPSDHEGRFRALVEQSSEIIAVLDPATGHFRYVSESVERLLGVPAWELQGAPAPWNVVHDDDRPAVQALVDDVAQEAGATATIAFRVRHADGSWRVVETAVRNLSDHPQVQGLVLNTRDVTEEYRLREELAHQTFHDALTGLPNRALLADRLGQALARSGRTARPVAVLHLGLDEFKAVNDTFGHDAGDELLGEVARRLVQRVRSADTVARLGSDEFAVLLADVDLPDRGEGVARRILQIFESPFRGVEDREIRLSVSIGIADATTGLEDPVDVMRNADVAMYMAKRRGGSRFEFFEPGMSVDASQRIALETELRQAIDRRELFLEYQPVIDLRSRRIEAVEALVRWHHPTRGIVPPDDFIPLAEDTGLIGELGAWVLVEACSQVKRWHDDVPGMEHLIANVNLSAWQVRERDVVALVTDALSATGLAPRCLTLEITESLLVDDVDEVVDRLGRLKDLGVGLAIDDFGTGYSSLSYLHRFPIDVLKIDRSFVQGLLRGPEESALAKAIIKLGRTFHLRTVAEGIERSEQAAILMDMGCDGAQGFYFSPPAAPAVMEQVLRKAVWDGDLRPA